MSVTGFHPDVPVSQFPRESNNWMCHRSKDFHCSTLAAEVTVPDLIFTFDTERGASPESVAMIR